MSSAPAHHSQGSVQWGTPTDVKTAIAQAFGGSIDYDPCCSPPFQGHARRYEWIDGLGSEWRAENVFCNPPGEAAEWWAHMHRGFLAGHFQRGAFLAYSIEQLSSLQKYGASCFPIVIGNGRWSYTCRAVDRLAALVKNRDAAIKRWNEAKTDKKQKQYATEYRATVRAIERVAASPSPDTLVEAGQPSHASGLILLGSMSYQPLFEIGALWAPVAA